MHAFNYVFDYPDGIIVITAQELLTDLWSFAIEAIGLARYAVARSLFGGRTVPGYQGGFGSAEPSRRRVGTGGSVTVMPGGRPPFG